MAPKLTRLTPKKVLAILQRHGFVVDHVTGSHWILYQAQTQRRVTLPLHTKTLPIGTLHAIWKQGGLPRDDFR